MTRDPYGPTNRLPGAASATRYVPGHADAFGDRLVMLADDGPALDILRFHDGLAATPGFETALRAGFADVSAFRHPTFAMVHGVYRLEVDGRLAIVSDRVEGQRLGDFFRQTPRVGLPPAVVAWLVRELTGALAALQSHAPGTFHGVLTADRIVLTPAGELRIVEHTLGPALAALSLTPSSLSRDFGLVSAAGGESSADARGDVTQLAAIALSLLLARPIAALDVTSRLPFLLANLTATSPASSRAYTEPLRAWLARALGNRDRSYLSASDARDDATQLPVYAPQMGDRIAAWADLSQEPSAAVDDGDPLDWFPSENETPSPQVDTSSEVRVEHLPAPEASPAIPVASPAVATAAPEPAIVAGTAATRRRALGWLVAAMALTILAQAGIITSLVGRARGAPAGHSTETASVPAEANGSREQSRSSIPAGPIASAAPDPDAPSGPAGMPLSRGLDRGRGGIQLVARIQLHVFEGDELLGSSDEGLITLTAGTHHLEFVNWTHRYRRRQTVTVNEGEVLTLRHNVPRSVTVAPDP